MAWNDPYYVPDISKSLSTAVSAVDEFRQNRRDREVGEAAATGKLSDAANVALKQGNLKTGLALKDLDDDRRAKVSEVMTRAAMNADTPEKWAQLQSAIQKRFPGEDIEPFEEREGLMAQFRDPYKEQELGLRRQQMNMTVQERRADNEWRRQQAEVAQRNADRSFGLQEQALNKRDIPAGFQSDPSGGLAPIPGGPADPKYLRDKSERPNPPSGYAWNDPSNPAAGLIAIPGGPATSTGSFNEGQANAATYADRMREAEEIIQETEKAGLSRQELGKSKVPVFGNSLVSEDFQKLDQASRNFINAVLRKESGAVISDSEFENARKQYLPEPGDTEAKLEQKRANRKTALDGISRAAGPSYKPKSGAEEDPLGLR